MTTQTATTLVEAFRATVAGRPGAVALRSSDGTRTFTWRQYADQVDKIAAGLAGLGVGRGDTVALMLTNRPEFSLIDTAAMHLGALPFSIYNTSSPEQVAYLLQHSDASVAVVEAQFVPTVVASGVSLKHLVVLDGPADGATIAFEDLATVAPADFDVAAAGAAVTADDLLTLIYTSGTTGTPKGVELTHANVLAAIRSFNAVATTLAGERTISYLPSAHVADRLLSHYMPMLIGVEVTYLADPKQIATVLPQVRPNLWLGVPRIWEKIKFAVEAKLAAETSPVKKKLAERAIALGVKRVRNGGKLSALDEAQFKLLDKVVLSKVRATLGLDELRFGFSGAAPIAADTLEFFAALGITIGEVWGLSETCAGTTLNPPGAIRIGTVGKPVPGVELKLAADGEILVRGPMVMRGYRKDPEKTAEVLDADGWFTTGDIGVIEADGYVRIVDRKKDMIINASGKNMSPSAIENTLKTDLPLAQAVVLVGDAKPYNVALISLDAEAAAAVAAAAGRTVTDPADLAADPAVVAAVAAGVAAGNSRLSRVEQVKKHVIVPEAWLPGGNELTPTLKVRRKPVETAYADTIESLYA
ncbi:long-chain fatty acid--CoA ligase [Williamsia sp. CHRR-6]|uniref:AMP-dependent synthetase/ligase n=1 Tax=Williamsia sp. CHRR-6 TaxID=2835871 RepID=UPI001BDA7031|nr:AMP-dependent synthetase/ligase [Williamsia sp. CHRR-6]MBT0567259.1 long-chain fatty acid--CoA ligase [Williamsia sp. CHRR-6]